MRGWLSVCERLLQHRQRVREQRVKEMVEEIKSVADAFFAASYLPVVLEAIQAERDAAADEKARMYARDVLEDHNPEWVPGDDDPHHNPWVDPTKEMP